MVDIRLVLHCREVRAILRVLDGISGSYRVIVTILVESRPLFSVSSLPIIWLLSPGKPLPVDTTWVQWTSMDMPGELGVGFGATVDFGHGSEVCLLWLMSPVTVIHHVGKTSMTARHWGSFGNMGSEILAVTRNPLGGQSMAVSFRWRSWPQLGAYRWGCMQPSHTYRVCTFRDRHIYLSGESHKNAMAVNTKEVRVWELKRSPLWSPPNPTLL